MNSIYSLIYVSNALVDYDADRLSALEQLAIEKNRDHGITGFLNFNDGSFMQYIEGQKEPLDQLMTNISADATHEVTHLIKFDSRNERLFPDWAMRVFTSTHEHESSIEGNVQRIIEIFTVSGYNVENVKELLLRNLKELR